MSDAVDNDYDGNDKKYDDNLKYVDDNDDVDDSAKYAADCKVKSG